MHNISTYNYESRKRWKKFKNDERDSKQIAECTAYGGYLGLWVGSLNLNLVEFSSEKYLFQTDSINKVVGVER